MLRNPPNEWLGNGAGAMVARRWLVLLATSALLHFIFLRWIDSGLHTPTFRLAPETVISMTLQHAEAAEAVPVDMRDLPDTTPVAKKMQRQRRPKPAQNAPAPGAIPQFETASTPPEGSTGMSASSVDAVPYASSIPVEPPDAQAGEEPPPDAPATAAQEADDPHYKVSPPPSVDLKYDVEKITRKGGAIYGHGNISWHAAGDDYVIDGNAGILFITALTFKSTGVIDQFGVSPVLYSEKRFRKSETNTHFHRERNTISFSASETSYPRKGGEQDRASIIWQLAGIGRGDGEKFLPDAEINLFVAGVRDGEMWSVRVIGQEDIETGSGKMATWHVVRAPRKGSYDQQLDIWLAPKHEWYPVKLRYTETNGDYLDMLLSDMTYPKTH
jgi:hypothetical protein